MLRRRSVLAGLAMASMASAGCLDRDGESAPSFAEWLPRSHADETGLEIEYVDMERVLEGPLAELGEEFASVPASLTGLASDELSETLSIQHEWSETAVLLGAGRDRIEDWTVTVPEDHDDEVNGFEVYEEEPYSIAVSDDAAVVGHEVRPYVEAVLGEVDRVTSVDSWSDALERVANAPAVFFGANQSEDGVTMALVTLAIQADDGEPMVSGYFYPASDEDLEEVATVLESGLPDESTIAVEDDHVAIEVSVAALEEQESSPDPVQATVDVSGSGTDEIQVSVTSAGNADQLVVTELGGDRAVADGVEATVGALYTVAADSEADIVAEPGEYSVVAVIGELEAGDSLEDADGDLVLASFELAE